MLAADNNPSKRQRLSAVLISMLLTMTVGVSPWVLRDLMREADFHWGNGGEEEVVGYLLLGFCELALPTLIVAVLPFILLVSPSFQMKRWPAMIGLASLLPILLQALLLRHGPARIWHDLYDSPGIYVLFESFAVIGCGVYLLLLRWLSSRSHERSHPLQS
jgi:hypothetical protein